MFVYLIVAGTLSVSAVTGVGAVKSMFLPPPPSWLAPFFVVATILTLVLALLIRSLGPVFDLAKRANDPHEQIKIVDEALKPILEILQLLPKTASSKASEIDKQPDKDLG